MSPLLFLNNSVLKRMGTNIRTADDGTPHANLLKLETSVLE
jgi:hypothetical protein